MTGVSPDLGTRRGVVLVNEPAGRDAGALAELRERFAGCDIDVVPASAIASRARDARKAGARFVAVVGGDRVIRPAAEELAHGDTALVPVPNGRANRFARSLGIEVLDDAAAATRTDHVYALDLGRVNDRGFVNYASVGTYPGVIDAPSWRAVLRAVVAGPRCTLRLDRRPVAAWLVFVGNGCYGEDVHDIEHRENIDEHLLDVRVVRADGRFARLRLALALLTRRTEPLLERRTCRSITIDVRGRASCEVALDDEFMRLSTPLRFESDAGALAVMRPGEVER
jgi:undecaprenyl-diphosphatase